MERQPTLFFFLRAANFNSIWLQLHFLCRFPPAFFFSLQFPFNFFSLSYSHTSLPAFFFFLLFSC